MPKNKTILIAPLDWGLGHAARCVPLIRHLSKNNNILLGVTPLTKLIFDEEFSDLKQIDLPHYNVRYSKKMPLWLKLGLDSPRITRIIRKEHRLLNDLIEKYKIDIVISDNRFGLHSKKAQSIFITHQLFLKTPVFKAAAQRINKKYILQFDEVWIPDYEDEKNCLSGDLSHSKKHFNSYNQRTIIKYIGPQSRLEEVKTRFEKNKYDFLILLSGPEPTRSVLEEALLKKLGNSNKKIVFVRGSKFTRDFRLTGFKNPETEFYDFPSKAVLKKLILSSYTIICRSGYSTLMDLHFLGKKKLILIPTPGQSEQEYLANYWKKKFNIEVCKQADLKNLML